MNRYSPATIECMRKFMRVKTIVSWDLGATKCAAGVVEYHGDDHYHCRKHARVYLKDCDSLDDLVNKLEQQLEFDSSHADAVCIGGAGHFNGTHLLAQNAYPFPMDFAHLQRARRWKILDVIHDYSSVACATFTSYIKSAENVRMLHHGKLNPLGRRVTLGVGTGLGLKDGVLLPDGQFWIGNNEAGHIGLIIPPHTHPEYVHRHDELQKFMRLSGVLGVDEPLTFEKILSGKGTVRLHQFVTGKSCDTPEILGHMIRAGDAGESVEIFAWYLGLLIGTVQLLFMPSGGLWITGGVILKHPEVFDSPEFYKGIEASPAYMTQRQEFPLGVLMNPDHALIGGAYYAVNRLLQPELCAVL